MEPSTTEAQESVCGGAPPATCLVAPGTYAILPPRYALLTGEYPFRVNSWNAIFSKVGLIVDPARASALLLRLEAGRAGRRTWVNACR